MLANSQQLTQAMAESFAVLEDDEDSALSRIAHAAQLIEPLGGNLEEVRRLSADLGDIRYRLQETARDIARFGSSIRHDPARRRDAVSRRFALRAAAEAA